MSYTYIVYETTQYNIESDKPLSYQEVMQKYHLEEVTSIRTWFDDVEDEDGLRPNCISKFIENLEATLEQTTDPDAHSRIMDRLTELNRFQNEEE